MRRMFHHLTTGTKRNGSLHGLIRLVNIADLDSSLVVKLMYTQADNFTGEVLYDNLTEATCIQMRHTL